MTALAVPNYQPTGSALPRPRSLKDPALELLTVMVLQALATTTTAVSAPVSADWSLLLRDPSATGVWVGKIQVTVSAPEILDEIKNSSGLTWEQLSRIMGVSRRSIHLWLQGKTLSPANEERLHTILHIVRSLGGRSQLEVRSRMLDKSGGVSVAELLEAGYDDTASTLARQRALSQGVPLLFDHATSRSRETLDSRRGAMTAIDLLETGTGRVQTTGGQPKRARRIRRGTADGQ